MHKTFVIREGLIETLDIVNYGLEPCVGGAAIAGLFLDFAKECGVSEDSVKNPRFAKITIEISDERGLLSRD